MGNRDRLNLFPSTANLVLMKQRVASAQMGLNLLKRKRDALEIHLRQLSLDLQQQRENLDMAMKDAIFSMAKANFLGTDFKPASVMNPNLADVYLRIKSKKMIGLKVPTLELVVQQNNAMNFTGLARGGQQVQIIREKYQEALNVIVIVASLEYSVSTIKAAVKQNNMRVNGLEYVLLPCYENTVIFIRDELDELGREEFYRLKRSQAKQMKKKAELIKQTKSHYEKQNVKLLGTDFLVIHSPTEIEQNLSARPKNNIQAPRKTVTKIRDKTVILATQQRKPVVFDEPLKEALPKKTVTIKAVAAVTSSSSDFSD